jgi:hypothetical protein
MPFCFLPACLPACRDVLTLSCTDKELSEFPVSRTPPKIFWEFGFKWVTGSRSDSLP